MASKTRSKNLWHIPKRGSLHQTIAMLIILAGPKFNGKKWTTGKQELMATEMKKAGMTKKKLALSHQSARTLLAEIPKFLGFVFVDEDNRTIRITQAGRDLIRNYENIEVTSVTTSNNFRDQMLRLIITNPIISEDCENVLVFPFRLTLELLLKINYIDIEEIAFFLFHVKSHAELPKLISDIENFRKLPNQDRAAIIDKYKKTPEGNLTLTKAPSARYYMTLCCTTGVCRDERIEVNKTNTKTGKPMKLSVIKLKDRNLTELLLKQFEDVEVFDFKNNRNLWEVYFGNPNRNPPIICTIETNSPNEFYMVIESASYSEKILRRTSQANPVILPFFEEVEYRIRMFSDSKVAPILSTTTKFSKIHNRCKLDLNVVSIPPKTKDKLIEQILELITSRSGFDQEYELKIKSYEMRTGIKIDSKQRGGRLESLFNDLLKKLETEKMVRDVVWRGKINNYGICQAAPAGLDLSFGIDELEIVLELTTIHAITSQWNAEGSSVPAHITEFREKEHPKTPKKNIIGIFSAPAIFSRVETMLKRSAQDEKLAMLCLSCDDFIKILLQDKEKIKNDLRSLAEEQLES